MQDFNTQKRQAWLREIQHRQVESIEVTWTQRVGEFVAALLIFALPIVMLFAGEMLGIK